MWCEVGVQISFFLCGYPFVLVPFVEKIVISPILMGPSALFFSKIVLAILGPLNFYINFRINLSILAKMPVVIWVEIALNL